MPGTEEDILQAWAVARVKEAELLELLENRIKETARIETEHDGPSPECGLLQAWAGAREKEVQLLELLENRIKETYESDHVQLRTASSDMYNRNQASLNGEILTEKPRPKLWRSTKLPANMDIAVTQQSIVKVSKLRPTAEPFVMPSSDTKSTVGFVTSPSPVSQPSSATGRPSSSPCPSTSLVSSSSSSHLRSPASSVVSSPPCGLQVPTTSLVSCCSSNLLLSATSLLPQLHNVCSSKGWTLHCQLSEGAQVRRCYMKVQDSSGRLVHSSWGVGGSIREAQGVAARAMELLFRQLQHNLPAQAEASKDLTWEKPQQQCLGNSVTLGRALPASISAQPSQYIKSSSLPKPSSTPIPSLMSLQTLKPSPTPKLSQASKPSPTPSPPLAIKPSPAIKHPPTVQPSPTVKLPSTPKPPLTWAWEFKHARKPLPTSEASVLKASQNPECSPACNLSKPSKASPTLKPSQPFKTSKDIKFSPIPKELQATKSLQEANPPHKSRKFIVSQMKIKDCEAPVVIGQDGNTVHFIEKNSGARVNICRKKGRLRDVSITGSATAVELAKNMIMGVINLKYCVDSESHRLKDHSLA